MIQKLLVFFCVLGFISGQHQCWFNIFCPNLVPLLWQLTQDYHFDHLRCSCNHSHASLPLNESDKLIGFRDEQVGLFRRDVKKYSERQVSSLGSLKGKKWIQDSATGSSSRWTLQIQGKLLFSGSYSFCSILYCFLGVL